MARKILFVAIVGIAAIANLCGAELLPATDYIDVTNYDVDLVKYQTVFKELVEKHGSKDVEETFNFIQKLDNDVRALANGRDIDNDQFDLKTRLDSEGLKEVGKIVWEILGLRLLNYSETARETLYSLIKVFYGKDLKNFASVKHPRNPKLHAMLLYIAKRVLSKQLEWNGESIPLAPTFLPEGFQDSADKRIEIIITQGLKNDYSEAELISKARKMDLLKGDFKAESMLEGFKKHYGKEDVSPLFLYESIKNTCDGFKAIYGDDLELFTWGRVVIPDKVDLDKSSRNGFLKRVEFWRVCLPVINSKNLDSLRDNVARNLSKRKSLKSMIGI